MRFNLYLVLFTSWLLSNGLWAAKVEQPDLIYLEGLPNFKPNPILIDKQDRFFIPFGPQVYVITQRVETIIRLKWPEAHFRGSVFNYEVSSDGAIYALFKVSYRPRRSKTTYYRIYFASCQSRGVHDYHCRYNSVANWSFSEGQLHTLTYHYDGLSIADNDQLFFRLHYTYRPGLKAPIIRRTFYYLNGGKVDFSKYKHQFDLSFPVKERLLDFAGGNDFLIHGKEMRHPNDRGDRYTHLKIFDQKQVPHIFFHDPEDRSFYHNFWSPSLKKIQEVRIDRAESGLEALVFEHGKYLWSLHYFWRNPFNKGLALTKMDVESGEILSQSLIDSSKVRNSGWDLAGRKSSHHRLFLSFLIDKYKNTRLALIFKTPAHLPLLAEKFKKEGHPLGHKALLQEAGPDIKQSDKKTKYVNELNTAFQKPLKEDYLDFGTGLLWSHKTGQVLEASASKVISAPLKPKMDYRPSWLSTLSFQGKYGGSHLGLSYALKFVDDKVDESFSEDLAKYYHYLKGFLAWERLLFNFDLRISFESETSPYFIKDESGQHKTTFASQGYQQSKLSLLTLDRQIYFGFGYEKFTSLWQSFYALKRSIGETSYKLKTQGMGITDISTYSFHLGYSTLDYLLKYETKVASFFGDGEFGLGAAQSKVQSYKQYGGFSQESIEELGYQFYFLLKGDIGYIFHRKYENPLWGFSVKLSYRLDFLTMGYSEVPSFEESDEPAKQERVEKFWGHTLFRHGPFMFFVFSF